MLWRRVQNQEENGEYCRGYPTILMPRRVNIIGSIWIHIIEGWFPAFSFYFLTNKKFSFINFPDNVKYALEFLQVKIFFYKVKYQISGWNRYALVGTKISLNLLIYVLEEMKFHSILRISGLVSMKTIKSEVYEPSDFFQIKIEKPYKIWELRQEKVNTKFFPATYPTPKRKKIKSILWKKIV